jgi:hypothetical protein
MPYKDPEVRRAKHKEYSAKHYQANKDAVKAKSKRANESRRDWWRQYKASFGCFGCDENDPACLEFHHVITDGKQHNEDTAHDWRRRGWSRERIIEEVRLTCVPLCANCHRKVHEQTRQLMNEDETSSPDVKRRSPGRDCRP